MSTGYGGVERIELKAILCRDARLARRLREPSRLAIEDSIRAFGQSLATGFATSSAGRPLGDDQGERFADRSGRLSAMRNIVRCAQNLSQPFGLRRAFTASALPFIENHHVQESRSVAPPR